MTPEPFSSWDAMFAADMEPTLWSYCTVSSSSIFVHFIYYWGA